MIKQIANNVWQICLPSLRECVYLLKLQNKNILIDTGAPQSKNQLMKNLEELKIKPENINIILLTHNHFDHNGNIDLFKNAKLKKTFPKIKTIHAPGHTQDDVCFLYKNILFSGDVIFDKDHNYIGRTDFLESQPEKMKTSLEKLKKIKYKTLAPGHLI